MEHDDRALLAASDASRFRRLLDLALESDDDTVQERVGIDAAEVVTS